MPSVPAFLPSQNAPLFPNDGQPNGQPDPWPRGTNLSVSILGLPPVSIDATHMGLCGGMSFLTRDIFESARPQLRGRHASSIPLPLAQHILSRLVQSFDGAATVQRWIVLTQALDHDTIVWGAGLFRETVRECSGVMRDIDAGVLCPIGVVLVQSWGAWDVFQNHVELVWGYERFGDILRLHTYDCNRPGRDDIFIELDISSPTPAKPITTNGTDIPTMPGRIRGLFRLPYAHADPSPAYVDDAVVTAMELPPARMEPRATAQATLVLRNTGSTTWTEAAGYRLGSQDPQDNTTWGTNRVTLPVGVDPNQTATVKFTVSAPPTVGQYGFSWQMVHENVTWFGTRTPSVHIGIGPTTGLCEQLHQQHIGLAEQMDDVRAEIADLDWSDPITRHEAGVLARRARALQIQITNLETQQVAAGCAPG
jgi:Ig-like domain from next to BRCA1 gene